VGECAVMQVFREESTLTALRSKRTLSVYVFIYCGVFGDAVVDLKFAASNGEMSGIE
jgi:hypothetical protein